MSSFAGRKRRYGHLHGIQEINVMPLVDVLLQLFIAVIIFFPVVEYGMGINLPKGTTETIKREQTRTISVDKSGRIFLNDVPQALPQLKSDLAALANHNPPITVLLKADAANNYGGVMEVLKQLHAAKITRIALMTQEENVPKLARR